MLSNPWTKLNEVLFALMSRGRSASKVQFGPWLDVFTVRYHAMVSIRDFGIDRLPEDERLLLARQILDSLHSPPGTMSEAELEAEEDRRDAELDAHPEIALTHEQFWARPDKRK
jgi:putative addiction module component (TIGR02574 family)